MLKVCLELHKAFMSGIKAHEVLEAQWSAALMETWEYFKLVLQDPKQTWRQNINYYVHCPRSRTFAAMKKKEGGLVARLRKVARQAHKVTKKSKRIMVNGGSKRSKVTKRKTRPVARGAARASAARRGSPKRSPKKVTDKGRQLLREANAPR
jgi:hypothetical protein